MRLKKRVEMRVETACPVGGRIAIHLREGWRVGEEGRWGEERQGEGGERGGRWATGAGEISSEREKRSRGEGR